MGMSCFNTIQYDIDLKLYLEADLKYLSFNTIQYDIDLKLIVMIVPVALGFNTIQYDIDLKLMPRKYIDKYVLIPFNMT